MSREAMQMALDALEDVDADKLGAWPAIGALRAALAASDKPAEPYAWAISGMKMPYYGEHAELDAKSEARRIGGTARAFPLYTADPKVTP